MMEQSVGLRHEVGSVPPLVSLVALELALLCLLLPFLAGGGGAAGDGNSPVPETAQAALRTPGHNAPVRHSGMVGQEATVRGSLRHPFVVPDLVSPVRSDKQPSRSMIGGGECHATDR